MKKREVWNISMEDFGVYWIRRSVGIPTGFSVGMGWVWKLKTNSHGSPDDITKHDNHVQEPTHEYICRIMHQYSNCNLCITNEAVPLPQPNTCIPQKLGHLLSFG